MAFEPIGVHLAAPAAGAERNHRPEHVVEHLPFAGRDVRGNFVGVLGVARLGEPGTHIFRGRRAEPAVGDGLLDLCQASDCELLLAHVAAHT